FRLAVPCTVEFQLPAGLARPRAMQSFEVSSSAVGVRMEVKLKEMDRELSAKSAKLEEKKNQIRKGGAPKYHQKLTEEGKLFVRDRLRLLLDQDFVIEDADFANCLEADLPADGVVTGIGQIEGQTVCF